MSSLSPKDRVSLCRAPLKWDRLQSVSPVACRQATHYSPFTIHYSRFAIHYSPLAIRLRPDQCVEQNIDVANHRKNEGVV
jgi:hypothetical protein